MKKQSRPVMYVQGDKKSDSAEAPSTRWWESYLVRYFLGFIVGCIFVVIVGVKFDVLDQFIKHLSSTVPTAGGKPDWTAITLLVAILGLGFCYIASTPITVLHAGRYGRGWFDGQSRYFWVSWILLGGIGFVTDFLSTGLNLGSNCWLESIAILLSCFLMYGNHHSEKPIDEKNLRNALLFFVSVWLLFFWGFVGRFFSAIEVTDKSEKIWWILSIPAFWVLVGQYAVLYRLLREKDKLFEFYKKLFKARRMKSAKDVRDTYTHLREHSNSIFVVVIEISLFALFMATSNLYKKYKNDNYDLEYFGAISVFFLVMWMIPTVFMWARANSLELDFSENPNSYLK